MDPTIANLTQDQRKVWEDIEEILAPSTEWPGWIWQLYLGQNLTHAQRPMVVAFAVFNGLDPAVSQYISISTVFWSVADILNLLCIFYNVTKMVFLSYRC